VESQQNETSAARCPETNSISIHSQSQWHGHRQHRANKAISTAGNLTPSHTPIAILSTKPNPDCLEIEYGADVDDADSASPIDEDGKTDSVFE
jgi:hypothetical protein